MQNLTIVSANYLSKDYIELNYKLNKQLYNDFQWIVVTNDHEQQFDNRFISIEGAARPGVMKSNVNAASHHHALALNLAIPHVNTRFVLFIDPDFYLVANNGDVLEHMEQNDLSFFGAPYAMSGKWRPVSNFPVAFCMYVDTEKVDISTFDFTPMLQPDQKKWYDTGHKIYEQYYKNDDHKFEIVTESNTGAIPNVYMWQHKTFGVHVRTKLHLKNKRQREIMCGRQLKHIESFITQARNE